MDTLEILDASKDVIPLLLLDDIFIPQFLDWGSSLGYDDIFLFMLEADCNRFRVSYENVPTDIERLISQYCKVDGPILKFNLLSKDSIEVLNEIISSKLDLYCGLATMCDILWDFVVKRCDDILKIPSFRKKIVGDNKFELLSVLNDKNLRRFLETYMMDCTNNYSCLMTWRDTKSILTMLEKFKQKSNPSVNNNNSISSSIPGTNSTTAVTLSAVTPPPIKTSYLKRLFSSSSRSNTSAKNKSQTSKQSSTSSGNQSLRDTNIANTVFVSSAVQSSASIKADSEIGADFLDPYAALKVAIRGAKALQTRYFIVNAAQSPSYKGHRLSMGSLSSSQIGALAAASSTLPTVAGAAAIVPGVTDNQRLDLASTLDMVAAVDVDSIDMAFAKSCLGRLERILLSIERETFQTLQVEYPSFLLSDQFACLMADKTCRSSEKIRAYLDFQKLLTSIPPGVLQPVRVVETAAVGAPRTSGITSSGVRYLNYSEIHRQQLAREEAGEAEDAEADLDRQIYHPSVVRKRDIICLVADVGLNTNASSRGTPLAVTDLFRVDSYAGVNLTAACSYCAETISASDCPCPDSSSMQPSVGTKLELWPLSSASNSALSIATSTIEISQDGDIVRTVLRENGLDVTDLIADSCQSLTLSYTSSDSALLTYYEALTRGSESTSTSPSDISDGKVRPGHRPVSMSANLSKGKPRTPIRHSVSESINLIDTDGDKITSNLMNQRERAENQMLEPPRSRRNSMPALPATVMMSKLELPKHLPSSSPPNQSQSKTMVDNIGRSQVDSTRGSQRFSQKISQNGKKGPLHISIHLRTDETGACLSQQSSSEFPFDVHPPPCTVWKLGVCISSLVDWSLARQVAEKCSFVNPTVMSKSSSLLDMLVEDQDRHPNLLLPEYMPASSQYNGNGNLRRRERLSDLCMVRDSRLTTSQQRQSTDVSLAAVLNSLGPAVVVHVLTLMLINRPLVLHAMSSTLLCMTMTALHSLCYPFQCQYEEWMVLSEDALLDWVKQETRRSGTVGENSKSSISFLIGIKTVTFQKLSPTVGSVVRHDEIYKFSKTVLQAATVVDLDLGKIYPFSSPLSQDMCPLPLSCSSFCLLSDEVRAIIFRATSTALSNEFPINIDAAEAVVTGDQDCKAYLRQGSGSSRQSTSGNLLVETNIAVRNIFRRFFYEILISKLPATLKHYPKLYVIGCDTDKWLSSLKPGFRPFCQLFIGSPVFCDLLGRLGHVLRRGLLHEEST